ncbi:ABC transporter substrate-binding protein [Galbitalea sp. SE-J8]|uniref:ABC transporter substrate-binding protein n=1 Tax=Galbitalea sp. SE-J8 TaxID=3054952 RepID=UPI00259D093E|nr:ABC transporter substrate-binding protein [Galbitalea sp. SE-J8]MDM4763895.1 ABC transporter substrate-binding protein [Galbitalea sp. SE-J8]
MTTTSPTRRRRAGVTAGAITTIAAAAILLSGCAAPAPGASSATPAAAQLGGTLTVLTQATSIELDPATSLNLPTTWLGLITRRLTTWKLEAGSTPEVVPDLATDTGTPSDDGTTWTYTLKDGIAFEDGTPITSADIKYGVERSYAPQLSGGLAYHKALLVGGDEYAGPYDGAELDSIETPDDKTIVFHLTTAYGDWPWIVAMNPFSPVPAAQDDPATYTRKPVASGPYRVESNENGTSLTLVRNEHWDRATDEARTAAPDEIVFKESQESSTTVQSLISDVGEATSSINSEPLDAAQLALVNGNPAAKARMITSGAGPLAYLAINTERITDLRVRRALEYAVDRKSNILAQGGEAAAVPATTLITPGIPGREEFDSYPSGDQGDVDKAKALLADAGATGLTLSLWVQNDPTSQAQGQALQQALERTGITIDLRVLDPSVWYADATGDDPDYDLILNWWLADYPSAASNLFPLYDSSQIGNGGFNLSRYSGQDEAIAAATAEIDPKQSQADWVAIDRALMDAAVAVPLSFARQSFLGGSEVADYFVTDYPGYQNYLEISIAQ